MHKCIHKNLYMSKNQNYVINKTKNWKLLGYKNTSVMRRIHLILYTSGAMYKKRVIKRMIKKDIERW